MITIKDIAQKTGFSVSTVSRALNNHPAISEESKKKVMECVENLKYKPNRNAQNLVNRNNKTIGIMIPDISDSFFSIATVSLESVLNENGYEVVYHNTNRKVNKIFNFLDMAEEYRFSGVFITPDTWSQELINRIHSLPMPAISFRRKTPFTVPEIPYADSDHYNGFKEAVEYLISLGHRNIALITANTLIYTERQRGYEEVIHLHGLESRISLFNVPGKERYKAGYDATQKLISEDPSITAIIAADDRFAIGVILYLLQFGIQVPNDISVIGCDNRPEGTIYPYNLTTIQQDLIELGKNAGRMMLSMLKDPSIIPSSCSLKPRLIIRNSTGYAPNISSKERNDFHEQQSIAYDSANRP